MACPLAISMDNISVFLQESCFNNDDEHTLYDVSDLDNNVLKRFERIFWNVLRPSIIHVRILWRKNLRN